VRKDRWGVDFRFIHKNGAGVVLFESGWVPNHMTDDGFELLFDVFFRGATAPTSFEIGLASAAISQTDSLENVTELAVQYGYAREGVDRDDTASGFPTLELDGGDMQIESTTVQFENTDETEAWAGATDAFLVGVMTGDDILINYRPLSVTRTLQPNDTLDVTFRVKGEQPA